MGIHGLLPPVVFTIEQQAKRILANVRRWESDLDKYIYLVGLQVSPFFLLLYIRLRNSMMGNVMIAGFPLRNA